MITCLLKLYLNLIRAVPTGYNMIIVVIMYVIKGKLPFILNAANYSVY